MNKKDTDSNQTERTKRLVEQLCEHPLLREQVEAILNLVHSDEGPVRKAHDAEERVWWTPTVKYWRVFKAQAGIAPRGKSRRLERILCDPKNTHALAQLRVLRSNSLWDNFWAAASPLYPSSTFHHPLPAHARE